MTKDAVLRVGRIPYANLLPMFHALEADPAARGFRFVPGDPSALNRKLRAGRLDVSPSSSIEYGRFPDRYVLCPGVSVSARRQVMSVLLLSREPLKTLSDEPIGVTTSSDTSVVLLEILLRESLGRSPRLVRTPEPPAAALRRHPAVLAIGDEAIRAALDGTAKHVTDMGAWWRRETGLPFVFALWIVSRAALARRDAALRRFAGMLLSAKHRAREALRGPVPASLGADWIPADFRRAYWRNLSYDLDREAEGLLHFFRLARKIGRIPSVPNLKFLSPL